MAEPEPSKFAIHEAARDGRSKIFHKSQHPSSVPRHVKSKYWRPCSSSCRIAVSCKLIPTQQNTSEIVSKARALLKYHLSIGQP